MTAEADLAAIGALLSDRTRATILTTLLNGGLTPASTLAERAGVSRSLASAHLRRLTEGRLIVVEPRRRQRLYRLAGQNVADALEVLLLLAPLAPVNNLRQSMERDGLREARLCYDHLAGRVGVALTDGLVARRLLLDSPGGYVVTDAGAHAFARLDVDVGALRDYPRPLTRACMDRSEERYHLAGSLGGALTGALLHRGWLQTREATRVVRLTDEGRGALLDVFGVEIGGDVPPPSTTHLHHHHDHPPLALAATDASEQESLTNAR